MLSFLCGNGLEAVTRFLIFTTASSIATRILHTEPRGHANLRN